MSDDPTVARWHSAIIEDCERALRRQMSTEEKKFVASRGGFIALEIIHDHVKSLVSDPTALARYLNSEAKSSDKPKA